PGIVCTIQNGIGVERILEKYFKNVVRGVTSYGANLLDFGHVMYAGEGCIFLPNDDLGREVEKKLRGARINLELVDNMDFRIWAKAVINSVINPITAICRVRNGRIVENEYLWKLATEIAEEGRELMKKLGYEFDAISEVKKVALATAKNRSSMLQDIERGERTEIDYINGVIIEKCREIGLKCSANEFIYQLVKGVENELSLGISGFSSTDT
ncbi:MAG: 2-dehydropantoate 2-reductase, partial [Archaeoglobaceae archaeon]|nr:2-dehydropantoate 2-reductase [Archaeoglobaceae archaeon]